jgi:hypothetical protein
MSENDTTREAQTALAKKMEERFKRGARARPPAGRARPAPSATPLTPGTDRIEVRGRIVIVERKGRPTP